MKGSGILTEDYVFTNSTCQQQILLLLNLYPPDDNTVELFPGTTTQLAQQV